MKRRIPLIITFIAGLVIICSIFIPPLSDLGEEFSEYFNIIACFAYILGAGNLIKVHGNKIYRQQEGFGYSAVTIVSFLLTLIVGIAKIGNPEGISGGIMNGGYFLTIYTSIYSPLSATMFALLGFYVASASFRAFRAKNKEATLLLSAAIVVLLGRTFLGNKLTDWLPENLAFLKIANVVNWLMTVPNLAGQRAILIGISLGIIATSLKIIIGIERSHLGSSEE